MIRHIVMFKLREFPGPEEKAAVLMELRERLLALPDVIPWIRSMEVGINVRLTPAAFDLVLTSVFDTLEDVHSYTLHPAHQDFIAFNKDKSVVKASVDYEFGEHS